MEVLSIRNEPIRNGTTYFPLLITGLRESQSFGCINVGIVLARQMKFRMISGFSRRPKFAHFVAVLVVRKR